MSVNITVSGKFAKHCSHPFLMDPQDAKKAEEKERRKLRLLQVREESKKLAKKIRDEVNEEKKRELQKLQAIKDKELECWRQHALQRKGQEYCEAIFQVGTAHEAARRETQEKYAKQKQPQGSYKDFKKQMAARKCQTEKVKFNCQPFCPCQQTQTSANKRLKCTCSKAQDKSENTEQEAHKRKRDLSFSSSESECEDEDEGYKEQTLPQSSITLSSTCESSLSTSEKNHASKSSMFVPSKNKCLIKTPSVYLDVEVGSDDSVTISAPAEVKDTHCKYNRQFSSVVRLSPRKERHKQENTCDNPAIQQSSTATTLSNETTEKEQNKSGLEKSQNSQFNFVQIPKEKRFTIISELVKKQENQPSSEPKNRANQSNSQATSANITPLLSPRKQLGKLTVRPPVIVPAVQSPRKTSATSKSSRTLTTQPLSSLTTAAKTNSAAVSSSSSFGRVQFYDYNSKLAKEKNQTATAVTVQRQRDQTTPSAMEQAEQEKNKEREKQLEELKKLQQIEERGQKALEREQIRRDCNELTEKLEVLSQEYPKQLPTNDNQLHIFADKQLRKEGKMNSAIEKLLQRPSIITCSEQNRPSSVEPKQKSTVNTKEQFGNILNVGSLNGSILPADDVSSDSCCSILLGYVDNQSKLIKQDIQKTENVKNLLKQKRLKDLLKRLDNLRNALLEELKNESKFNSETLEKEKSKLTSKENNLKKVFDSISELRKEHEELLTNEKDKNAKSLREREKLLKAKEELLERKVREFFELHNQLNQTSETQVNDDVKLKTNKEKNKVCATGENPLEIVITVKGDTKCVKIPQKPKRKIALKKNPSKVSTLIKSPQSSLTKAKKHTPKKKAQISNPLSKQVVLRRQNSYDSNSTSYMSLPSELPTKINVLAQAIAKQSYDQVNNSNTLTKTANQASPTQNQQQETESSLESLNIPPARVNPLIAQYVHRLLGMSRSAVQKLGISSSDIETPSSSIINTPDNIALSETHISQERLMTLQSFIEENKSFIKDVEQSIRSQNNVSLENSLRKLDDIWRQRLKSEKKDMKKHEQSLKQVKDNTIKQKPTLNEKNKIQQTIKTMPSKCKLNEPKSTLKENFLKDLSKSLSSHYSTEDKESTKSIKTNKRSMETVDKAINAKLSIDSSKSESDTQIARYAKLTENCTHRIAELTELINRVREEKQRLLEVTLSSVSENGKNSTEYLELPEGKTSTRTEQDDFTRVSSSSDETTQNKQSVNLNTLHDMSKLSSADKNKQLTNSRDSGIADSRPVTALDNRHDQEPLSQTSSESTHLPQAIRKMKPPPTLKRFSPQLPENELAHELSTIFEVDTPATSRINTAIGQSAEEKENALNNGSQPPIQFPTFEQYIEKMNLDITQLNAEQSLKLQQEFTAFLECLQQNKLSAESPKYSEFPSINAYLQQLAECDFYLGETLEESLAKLYISGIQPDHFPAVREYMKHNASKTLQAETQQLLDTESLENISDVPSRTNTDNDDDTASLDIQEELKKRNIIKKSFRVSETRRKDIFSSTAHTESKYYQDILAAESGIDKLSTSGNTSDLLDRDLKRLVQQFSREQKKKSKETKILSSTTMSTNVSSLAHSALRAASLHESSKKESGRPFNFRDFLTRELEKQVNNSSSTTSSSIDDSLRSYFLHSLLGSLTPLTPGAASKSGGQTLDRQKTSTPVPAQSSRAHSTTSSQTTSSSHLFSGESRLSSVHYQNRSEHGISSADANADQSSE